MFIFIYDEYFNEATRRIFDVIFCSIFLVEFFYNVYIHPSPRLVMLKTIDTYIDIITMVTPFITYMIKKNNLMVNKKYDSNRIAGVIRILKVFRILRLRKIVRKYTVSNKQDEIEEDKDLRVSL